MYQAEEYHDFLFNAKPHAFNVPAKRCWKNQHGSGYIFSDGSYMRVLKMNSKHFHHAIASGPNKDVLWRESGI